MIPIIVTTHHGVMVMRGFIFHPLFRKVVINIWAESNSFVCKGLSWISNVVGCEFDKLE